VEKLAVDVIELTGFHAFEGSNVEIRLTCRLIWVRSVVSGTVDEGVLGGMG
jgi:hypothetical protein